MIIYHPTLHQHRKYTVVFFLISGINTDLIFSCSIWNYDINIFTGIVLH